MSKVTGRCQVFGIKQKGRTLSEVDKYVYICHSTQGAAKMLGDFKNRVKNTKDDDSVKIRQLKVDVSRLEIILLSSLHSVEQAPAKVNEFIHKYDTLEHGWNSVFR